MCSSCKMDPSEMKVFYARQGAVEIEDFDDEVRFRPPGKGYSYNRRTKKARPPKGCPANNGKAHVWVWTSEYEETDIFYKHFGFHKKETKVCCGCLLKTKVRETERYMKRKERAWFKKNGAEFTVKRGEPVSRYGRYRGERFWSFMWEMDDPAYAEKYNAWREEQRRIYRESRWDWKYFPRSY